MRYWVFAAFFSGGTAFLFLFVFSLHIPVERPVVAVPTQPLIHYVGVFGRSAQGALYEQSMLSDPDPLFLPTSYNYGVEYIVDVLPDVPPAVKGSFLEAELLLGEVNFIAEYQGGGYYIPKPLDFVSIDFGQPFEALGQEAVAFDVDPVERVGVYRLYAGDKLLLEGVLPVSMDEVLDATLWMPVRFRLQVLGKSLVGEAFMVNSSGSEQVDKVLRGFVSQSDLAVRLGDGYYRLEITP